MCVCMWVGWVGECLKCCFHSFTLQGGRSEWVGCVGVDPGGEWVVCGGSQQPSIYHLSTVSRVASLDTPPGVVTQTLLFVKDKVS